MRRVHRTVITSVATLLFAACSDGAAPRSLSGYELTPAPVVGGVSLPDVSAEGADFPFVAADGELLIVYFGYTACPDVCPTTFAEVKKAFAELGDRAADVEVAMITIDPDRDTDTVVTGYVQGFIPSAHALRTDDEAVLAAAADAFGASFSVETVDGEVKVSHSAAMYVVDDTGTVVLTWPFGILAEGIATDLDILFDRGT